MKKTLLISLPLVLSACAYDVHTGVPYVVAPAPHTYHHPSGHYQQPYQPNHNYQQPHHDHHDHHDNGKHKGHYKNKNKHHDDD